MYPTRELMRLAVHKSALRRGMRQFRVQCARDAERLARPLQWLDRVAAFWQGLSQLTRLAAVPLGIIVQRTVFRRLKTLRAFVRWGALFVGAARVVRTVARLHTARSAS
jgi:hypothetical protein